MATHSSILAWEIPWTEEPDRLQLMGITKESDSTEHNTHQYTHYSNFLKPHFVCVCVCPHNTINQTKNLIQFSLFFICVHVWLCVCVCVVLCCFNPCVKVEVHNCFTSLPENCASPVLAPVHVPWQPLIRFPSLQFVISRIFYKWNHPV